jgi:hypothetical protein
MVINQGKAVTRSPRAEQPGAVKWWRPLHHRPLPRHILSRGVPPPTNSAPRQHRLSHLNKPPQAAALFPQRGSRGSPSASTMAGVAHSSCDGPGSASRAAPQPAGHVQQLMLLPLHRRKGHPSRALDVTGAAGWVGVGGVGAWCVLGAWCVRVQRRDVANSDATDWRSGGARFPALPHTLIGLPQPC